MKKEGKKSFLINTLKGIAIGISMIIPGVSGGTIAVLMNIYDKILEAVTGIFKHFKQSCLVLIPLIIGIIIGFVSLIFPLKYGLSHIPLVIISLFAGLIVGGIPFVYKKVQGKENPLSIVIGLIAMALVISFCFIKNNNSFDFTKMNVGLFFYLILCGFLSSIALVAPGISGSMTMMVLGAYTSIISALSELLKFQNVGPNLLILVPLAIGLIAGFILMSILMKYLLKNHETSTYFAILGFIIGSLVTIYYVTITDKQYPVKFDALNISLSIICLILGFLGSFLVERYVAKKEEQKDNEKESITQE